MRSFLTLIAVLSFVSAFGQTPELITGLVVDSASFAPLGYAGVQVKGTARGTITDSKGKFSIMASRRDTLQFSMLGYETIEVSLHDWESSAVRLPERTTLLPTIVIEDSRLDNPYMDLFREEYAQWKRSNRKLPFYYSRWKKEKLLLARARQEGARVRTYVDLVVRNENTKADLIKKHKLTEAEYYAILTKFNEQNHTFMYYLTAPELLTMLNVFFEHEAGK